MDLEAQFFATIWLLVRYPLAFFDDTKGSKFVTQSLIFLALAALFDRPGQHLLGGHSNHPVSVTN